MTNNNHAPVPTPTPPGTEKPVDQMTLAEALELCQMGTSEMLKQFSPLDFDLGTLMGGGKFGAAVTHHLTCHVKELGFVPSRTMCLFAFFVIMRAHLLAVEWPDEKLMEFGRLLGTPFSPRQKEAVKRVIAIARMEEALGGIPDDQLPRA